MTLWTEICDLVTRNQVTRLADRLVTLTEEERAELSGRLPGLVKELRRARTEQVRAQHPDDFEEMASWEVGDLLDKLADALLLTGVGVITGPAAAVTWMTARDVNRRWAEDPNVAQVCRVAATRPGSGVAMSRSGWPSGCAVPPTASRRWPWRCCASPAPCRPTTTRWWPPGWPRRAWPMTR